MVGGFSRNGAKRARCYRRGMGRDGGLAVHHAPYNYLPGGWFRGPLLTCSPAAVNLFNLGR